MTARRRSRRVSRVRGGRWFASVLGRLAGNLALGELIRMDRCVHRSGKLLERNRQLVDLSTLLGDHLLRGGLGSVEALVQAVMVPFGVVVAHVRHGTGLTIASR